jgi:uncharacterized protein YdaU (DUF1376 family)
LSDKTDAWMPLWIGSYLADTQHLTRDEHGAYLLMLMAYWRNAGPLQDDDKRLCAIVKATPKEWKSLRPVLAEFFTVADGVWTQKRVEKELVASLQRKEKAHSKAQAAAQARWSQPIKDAPSIAASNAHALLEQCPTPSPISTSLRSVDKNPLTPKGVALDGFADFWAAYPRKQAKVQAEKAWAKLKPSEALKSQILGALAIQRQSEQWTKDGGSVVPMPSTWLNQRRWEDQLPTGTTAPKADIWAGAL